MGIWKSPTGHTESLWTNGANAYDGNITTSANGLAGEAIVFEFTEVTSSKIRVYCDAGLGSTPSIQAEVYYGEAYHSIHNGEVSKAAWQELSVGSSQSISKVKITSNIGLIGVELYEIELLDDNATTISIGQSFHDAVASYAGKTLLTIRPGSAADGTGLITSIWVRAYNAVEGFKIGTFTLVSGNDYVLHDSASIGHLDAGDNNISGLSIAVTAADLIGAYWDSGQLRHDSQAHVDGSLLRYDGDAFVGGQVTYTPGTAWCAALTGAGTTDPPVPPVTFNGCGCLKASRLFQRF